MVLAGAGEQQQTPPQSREHGFGFSEKNVAANGITCVAKNANSSNVEKVLALRFRINPCFMKPKDKRFDSKSKEIF
jgi:hypothetical protein